MCALFRRFPAAPLRVCVFIYCWQKKKIRCVCVSVYGYLKDTRLFLVTCGKLRGRKAKHSWHCFASASECVCVCAEVCLRALHINNKCSSPVAGVRVCVCSHSISAVSCVQYQGQSNERYLRVNKGFPLIKFKCQNNLKLRQFKANIKINFSNR